jgi:YVTN family beta-propeller protein
MKKIVFPLVLTGLLCPGLSAQTDSLSAQEVSSRDRETVGVRDAGGAVTPVNQRVTPHGKFLELSGLRPQVLALSPDGKRVVVSGKTSELVVLDAGSGEVLQRVVFPSESRKEPVPDPASANILEPDKKGLASYTGLQYAPDGKWVYLSNVQGSIKVFAVAADGSLSASHSLGLPAANAPRRKQEIPAGIALWAKGKRLLVCGNLSNQLIELDAATGAVLRTFEVGVAPMDVVVSGERAYVSNWGGGRPRPGDLTGPAGRGTEVRVDAVRHIACEGSVSVVDLSEGSGTPPREIAAGLHPSGLAVSPNGRYVVCANAGSDTITVIDTKTDTVAETIWARRNPAELLGASPNALAFSPDGRTLYAANGSQNAVAVVDFDPGDRESKLAGLIPVGWFPGAIVFDRRQRQLVVANIKGLPSKMKAGPKGVLGFNSHQHNGSVSLVPLPSKETLTRLSETVSRNLRADAIAASRLPARPGVAPRPVPERVGEPSVFKHVVYIIKENRTYDQVLGDDRRGNGAPDLCIFGEAITPNQHKLARDFVLLDNTYCSGILSADGHQWVTTGFATAAMEKSFAGFPRSYPDGMGEDERDALIYSPAGFLWDNALKHGKSLRNFGEFAIPRVRWKDPAKKGSPGFLPCYRTWKKESDEVVFGCEAAIPTLEAFTPKDTVGWNMAVPDQFRADYFIADLQKSEGTGEWPHLLLVCLPQDHTSGTSPGAPTPAACVADNDLAFGRIVEAVSKSRFWPQTLILAIEDDPQAGWDHVSGYRTTAYCISPYTKRGAVVSTQYNTTSLLRTIEQVLGMPPMNQFDASATPMWECFVDEANLAAFDAVPSRVPLDQLNPPAKTVKDRATRRNAKLSARLNFQEIDKAPEDVLNRILWQAIKGNTQPYPAWATTADDDDAERAPGWSAFWNRFSFARLWR